MFSRHQEEELFMADDTVVHIGENSAEEVAFKLMHLIGKAEAKTLTMNPQADREWILKTYAQCLLTVRGPQHIQAHLDGLKNIN
jgi:hypothetical protein